MPRAFYRDIPADQLAKIVTSAGPFIRDLNLRGCVQIQNDWRLEACSNLVNASLEGCRLDRSAIHSLILRNSRLVYLNVSGLNGVTNQTCRSIAQSCQQLESLNVAWCSNMDAKGLRRIIDNCPRLRELRAGEIKGFDDEGIMETIFKTNMLERLLMPGCSSLTDDALRVMCEGVGSEVDPLTNKVIAPPRKLKHLDLSRCTGLTDVGIQSLAERVPDLEGLELAGCTTLTDGALTELIDSVPNLTHLDLEDLAELTNFALQNLSKAPCKSRLQHLSISYCEKLGDTGMLPVIKACQMLPEHRGRQYAYERSRTC